MTNKNKNITTKFRKSKSGGKSGVVSALDYTQKNVKNLFISKEGNSYQVAELQSTLVNYAFSFDLDVRRYV